jgi:3-dehydroquinate dehydratase-2
MKHPPNNKILVIHGPNMNLIGLRKMGAGITLDKLNYHLRIAARKKGLVLTIMQTNDESRAVNHLQRQRNKIKGILIYPGPWIKSGYVIKDTLELLSIPFITISYEKTEGALKWINNIEAVDIYKASEKALTDLAERISRRK